MGCRAANSLLWKVFNLIKEVGMKSNYIMYEIYFVSQLADRCDEFLRYSLKIYERKEWKRRKKVHNTIPLMPYDNKENACTFMKSCLFTKDKYYWAKILSCFFGKFFWVRKIGEK